MPTVDCMLYFYPANYQEECVRFLRADFKKGQFTGIT